MRALSSPSLLPSSSPSFARTETTGRDSLAPVYQRCMLSPYCEKRNEQKRKEKSCQPCLFSSGTTSFLPISLELIQAGKMHSPPSRSCPTRSSIPMFDPGAKRERKERKQEGRQRGEGSLESKLTLLPPPLGLLLPS